MLTIRDARPEELDEISKLIRASYIEYEANYSPERWPGYIDGVSDVRNRPGAHDLIVAEIDGRLVGAVMFYPDGAQSRQGDWPESWARHLATRGATREPRPGRRTGAGRGVPHASPPALREDGRAALYRVDGSRARHVRADGICPGARV